MSGDRRDGGIDPNTDYIVRNYRPSFPRVDDKVIRTQGVFVFIYRLPKLNRARESALIARERWIAI